VPWHARTGPVPAYPVASNLVDEPPMTRPTSAIAPQDGTTELREELRRLIIEELTTIIRS
jgi:acetaldehyde dehydrogenase/alcohol dehydrogenase